MRSRKISHRRNKHFMHDKVDSVDCWIRRGRSHRHSTFHYNLKIRWLIYTTRNVYIHSSKHVNKYIGSSTVHTGASNCVEATQMPINNRMDTQIVEYAHNGVIHSKKTQLQTAKLMNLTNLMSNKYKRIHLYKTQNRQ